MRKKTLDIIRIPRYGESEDFILIPPARHPLTSFTLERKVLVLSSLASNCHDVPILSDSFTKS